MRFFQTVIIGLGCKIVRNRPTQPVYTPSPLDSAIKFIIISPGTLVEKTIFNKNSNLWPLHRSSKQVPTSPYYSITPLISFVCSYEGFRFHWNNNFCLLFDFFGLFLRRFLISDTPSCPSLVFQRLTDTIFLTVDVLQEPLIWDLKK